MRRNSRLEPTCTGFAVADWCQVVNAFIRAAVFGLLQPNLQFQEMAYKGKELNQHSHV